MGARPSSRLVILDSTGRVLLFRFVHRDGALAGQDFWATPGGSLEDSETFEQAAIRELEEETGIRVNDVGAAIAHRQVEFQMPDGEYVIADERYFLIKLDDCPSVSQAGWTALEAAVMAEWRWWSEEEIAKSTDTIWPGNLVAMIRAARPR